MSVVPPGGNQASGPATSKRLLVLLRSGQSPWPIVGITLSAAVGLRGRIGFLGG
jgi:hypothetical protein